MTVRECLRLPGVCARWVWAQRPENVYRDFWLVAVTALVAVALAASAKQQDDLCDVVVDVHDASTFRLKAEQDRLTQTFKYLQDVTPQEEASGLPARVRQNVPALRDAVVAARKSADATEPPGSCTD